MGKIKIALKVIKLGLELATQLKPSSTLKVSETVQKNIIEQTSLSAPEESETVQKNIIEQTSLSALEESEAVQSSTTKEPKVVPKNIFEQWISVYGFEDSQRIFSTLTQNIALTELEVYIKEFELDKPENMVKFLIELNFECFDSVNAGIQQIQNKQLVPTISKIKFAHNKIKFMSDNEDERKKAIEKCEDELGHAINELQGHIQIDIDFIKEVDNYPKWKMFLKASSDLKKVDNTIARLTYAIQLYMQTIMLLSIIRNEGNNKEINGCLKDAEEFIQKLIQNGDIALILDYDVNKNRELWNSQRLLGQINAFKSIEKGIAALIEEECQ